MNSLQRIIHRLRCRPWKRDIKYFWQRCTRGWDDSETFSLDYSLAKLIAPRLKRFRDITIGIPYGKSEKKWEEELDKMIAAFEFAGSEAQWNAPPEEFEKHREGFRLFAKNYFRLWW